MNIMLTGSTPFFYAQQAPLGAVRKKSVQVYADAPSTRLTVERCAMHFQTCQNPVTVVSIAFATRLIHKLPLLVDLPSSHSIIFLTAFYFAGKTGKTKNNYPSVLRNLPEKQRRRLQSSGNLRSHIGCCSFGICSGSHHISRD